MQSIDFVKTGISLVYIINLSKVRFSFSFCYIYSYLSNPYVYYEKTWHAEKEQVSVTTTISKKNSVQEQRNNLSSCCSTYYFSLKKIFGSKSIPIMFNA